MYSLGGIVHEDGDQAEYGQGEHSPATDQPHLSATLVARGQGCEGGGRRGVPVDRYIVHGDDRVLFQN